jgi:ATP-dependent 26S proteasome regulatory subunit
MNLTDRLERIALTEDEDGRIGRLKELVGDISSREEVYVIADWAVRCYRRGIIASSELQEIKSALEDGAADLAIAVCESGEDDPHLIATRRSESYERFIKVEPCAFSIGDIAIVVRGAVVGVADPSLQSLFATDEGRIVELFQESRTAKVDFGAHHGERLVHLSHRIWQEDLRPGTRVLASTRYGIVFTTIPEKEGTPEETHTRSRKFAGFPEYRRRLEELIIIPLRESERYAQSRLFPIVVIINGPTGLGKTHGALFAFQQGGQGKCVTFLRGVENYRSHLFSGSENLILQDRMRAIQLAREGKKVGWLVNEAETLLGARSASYHFYSSVRDTLDAIVATWLSSIDILKSQYSNLPIVIVLTTNFYNEIDAAFLNDHRVDALIEVDYDFEHIPELIEVHIEDLDLDGDKRLIVERLSDMLTDESRPFLRVYTEEGLKRDIPLFVSPALISGICKSAEMKAKMESPEGRVTWKHVETAAVERIAALCRRLQNLQTLRDMMPLRLRREIGNVVRVEPLFDPDLMVAA